MGSGKSNIGKLLSKRILLKFIDLDDYIENKEGMSIPNIFENKGEIYFRKIESLYLNEILQKNESFILSLGGGTPCYSNNIETINENTSNSIYLQASIKTLAERIQKSKTERPLVSSLNNEKLFEFIGKHIFERKFFYQKANFTINVDNKSKSEIVNEITNTLN